MLNHHSRITQNNKPKGIEICLQIEAKFNILLTKFTMHDT